MHDGIQSLPCASVGKHQCAQPRAVYRAVAADGAGAERLHYLAPRPASTSIYSVRNEVRIDDRAAKSFQQPADGRLAAPDVACDAEHVHRGSIICGFDLPRSPGPWTG